MPKRQKILTPVERAERGQKWQNSRLVQFIQAWQTFEL